MSANPSLSLLIELATRDADQATVRLGAAIQAAEEAGQKLALLEQYRENYGLHCQENLAGGLSIWKYRNFQVFLNNIERAIVSQQEAVRKTQEHVEAARDAWQAIERKRLSYKVLDEQAAQRKLYVENRREQKLTDDHATRQHRSHYKPK